MHVGDSAGNLRVYDLRTLRELHVRAAHDGEVLALDYSPWDGFADGGAGADGGCPALLASAGRDGFIHIYDCRRGYAPLQTLGDHSAAATALRFGPGGERLLSCGADRQLVLRDVLGEKLIIVSLEGFLFWVREG